MNFQIFWGFGGTLFWFFCCCILTEKNLKELNQSLLLLCHSGLVIHHSMKNIHPSVLWSFGSFWALEVHFVKQYQTLDILDFFNLKHFHFFSYQLMLLTHFSLLLFTSLHSLLQAWLLSNSLTLRPRRSPAPGWARNELPGYPIPTYCIQ